MKISTKGRYATRAMLDLALHYDKTPVFLKDISARQGISLRYLEQIISPLIAAKIVTSTRGPKGGVMLARPPQKIKLSEVIQVLEGPISPVECVENPGVCTRASSCVARDVWTDLAKAMYGVLESTTLQDLVERQEKKRAGRELLYNI
jgi:Rrf2 family cysteine metabolism transcriptional repressor